MFSALPPAGGLDRDTVGAGVIAKLILFSSGALANIPLSVRVGAAIIGFLAFLAIRRSAFAGVLAGEAALLLGGFLFSH